MFALVAGGEIKILDRRFLRFLDKAVQQHHATAIIDIKENTGYPVAVEAGADLI